MGGPISALMPVQAVHCPTARPLSAPNVARSSAKLLVARSAPNTPWSTRPAIRSDGVRGDAAQHGSDGETGDPDLEEWTPPEPITECAGRDVEGRDGEGIGEHDPLLSRQRRVRSRPIVGNAMFTTVPSTNVIDEPTMVAIRVSRRRSTRAGSSGAAGAAPLNDT